MFWIILLVIILIFVLKIMKARKETAENRERERRAQLEKEAKENTPERLNIRAAHTIYCSDRTKENREAFLKAVDASPSDWDYDFRAALCFDSGTDGFPYDPGRAKTWYAKARKKAEALKDTNGLNTFFEYYNRPYGNFKNGTDKKTEHAQRLETALVMSTWENYGIVGCEWGHVYGARKTVEIVKNLPGYSPFAVLILEHFASFQLPYGNPDAKQNAMQRLTEAVGVLSSAGRMLNEEEIYAYFLLGQMLLENHTPYLDAADTLARDVGMTREGMGVKFLAIACSNGSAEALYERLLYSGKFAEFYKWDKSAEDFRNHDDFINYIVREGWTEYADMMAKKFFPNEPNKDNWMNDDTVPNEDAETQELLDHILGED